MRPASDIHVFERDYCLDLNQLQWPPKKLPLLQTQPRRPPNPDKPYDWFADNWLWSHDQYKNVGFLRRWLHRKFRHSSSELTNLHEAVVRFPSAPLFGTQRKVDYLIRMVPVHQHTLRLLTRGEPESRPEGKPIRRIFLLINGLNEIPSLKLYYDMAALLIGSQEDVACLICPTPGHLTRYPMIGNYAERPLQRFINDPGELFRQYLRFMIEIQWLLSALVPVGQYPVAPGISLVAESTDSEASRCNSRRLSSEIAGDCRALHDFSLNVLEGSEASEEQKARRREAPPASETTVLETVETLRWLIGWAPSRRPLTDYQESEPLPPPLIHLVGYSLGAYLAQSVFFGWPFAVSSCTTVCAGAALRDLRPVKLAHEEEWRSVTRGLKYEIESGMLEGRIQVVEPAGSRGSVFGIPASLFSSLFQIFNDVFLQDPYGSYRTRVSEFSPRLLFVLGGSDPIVPTKSVVEASPPEGINLIEIANLSHFLAKEKEEGEWSSFWLPTVARVISDLAEHSEALCATSVLWNLWNEDITEPIRNDFPKLERTRSDRLESEPLDSDGMLRMLIQLVEALKNGGFLFILRNQVPFALMGPRLLHRRGGVPHYENFHVRRFWQELQNRRRTMLDCAGRITIVLPARQEAWFVKKPSIISARLQPVTHEVRDRDWLQEIWDDFLRDWASTGALFQFHAEEEKEEDEAPKFPLPGHDLEGIIKEKTCTPEHLPVINTLPDTWISLTEDAFKDMDDREKEGRESANHGLVHFATNLYREPQGTQARVLEGWLKEERIKVIRISAADSNPRFLGERITDHRTISELLIHGALAFGRSVPWAAMSEETLDTP